MLKKKVSIDHIIKHWFTYRPWLKLVALLLAIIVWFYVKGELTSFYD